MADDGKIVPIGIEEEMKDSYIDYAMSVIVGRALPDVRDGLKPVHRRILYGMLELGVDPGKAHKKSARIVGEVMGKYHPHGDSAIYESIARMTQDFSLRYPLIDGQGNFGSIDGDPPAAMRYTEARFKHLAMEILADIEKDTVDFMPNFDDSLMEPIVMPSKVPNLLINGSSGIAVGMATNIPPHNLCEVVDALTSLIDNPDISIEKLMEIMPGPDFPTGATICGRDGIRKAYTTGKGIITIRGRVEVEEDKKKEAIIIKEIPYEVNKANLVSHIAHLVSDNKINGISEVRDESDKEGMRIVLEVKRGENVDIIINQLYKYTQLQTSYGIINLALSNKQPRLLNIKQMLQLFLDHRKEIVLRRAAFELRKAEERYHIVCGLIIALDNLDRVIKLIRNSKTVEEAKESLMSTFKMSEKQAQAVLAMPLSRLTGLERDKILKEQEELQKTIKELQGILADPEKVKKIIKNELNNMKNRFGDERRTEIVGSIEDFDELDLIRPEDIIVTISSEGYIKRTSLELYKRQRRGGKGFIGAKTKEEDYVKHLFVCSTTDTILFFTEKGQVHWLRGHLIPDAGKNAKGKPIVNLLTIDTGERIAAVIPVKEFTENCYLLMVTQKGIVKKTTLNAYSRPRRGGIKGISLRPKDRLIEVRMTDGLQDIVLSTKHGLSIRFSEKEIHSVGRSSIGVIGIRFKKKEDEVVGCEIFPSDEKEKSLFTVCSKGFGKRTMIYNYRRQHRGGKGIIDIKTGGRNGYVVGIKCVKPKDELILITRSGQVLRMTTDDARTVSRNTAGVRVQKLAQGDIIMDIALVSKEDEEV
ncbi:MAG TPA: DNA gyrase subunit A [bacterium]|nr:DNA gyrase subunit A [bacterium]